MGAHWDKNTAGHGRCGRSGPQRTAEFWGSDRRRGSLKIMTAREAPLARLSSFTVALFVLGACSEPPDPKAANNQPFYAERLAIDGTVADDVEAPEVGSSVPCEENSRRVKVLRGIARFCRPSDWVIRRFSLEPERRFIEYVSPRQVVFSVYERLESPRDAWATVMDRYRSEASEEGAHFLSEGVPVAAGIAQARGYDVLRKIPAGKVPFVAHSREYLVHGDQRMFLIQMVRPRPEFGLSQEELVGVIQSLRVF